MENSEKEELLKELMTIEVLVKENPCGLNKGIMKTLRGVLHDFIAPHCVEGASREQVARYLGRDVRTLSRWKNEYDDFPQARHDGHKEVSYNWMEVVSWKLKHKELFE